VIFRRAYVDLNGMEQRLIAILGTRAGYNRTTWCCSATGADRIRRAGRPGSELPGRAGRTTSSASTRARSCRAQGALRRWAGCAARTGPALPRGDRLQPADRRQGEWLLTWFAPWLDPAFPHPAKPGELRWRCMRADGSIAWVDGPGST
jgi:hypothetical protein